MSFAKSKRFIKPEEVIPPVGSYDPKSTEKVTSAIMDDNVERFKAEGSSSEGQLGVGDGGSMDALKSWKEPLPPTKVRTAIKNKLAKPHKPCRLDAVYVKGLEKQLYKLTNEATELDKSLQERDYNIMRLESRVKQTTSQKTALTAKLATAEKEVKDLDKANSTLKQQSKRWWHYFSSPE